MTDTAKAPTEVETVNVTIDGAVVTAKAGELIIEVAERAGVFIPRFCYHPRMEPVGMCRMCLVEVSGPRGFSLQPSCYIKVADGQEVLTNSAKARKAQEGVLEFLLVNHPLDCPVCDKGGECPLQDQAFSYGPGESRFVEEKRHWEKPIALSPLVELDRERCIQCARCTRFADEIAGEALIDFAYRGDKVEVATFPDRPFASYFSGNTVQICPVGALTAKPYRFKSRPWDLEQVETTCTTCSVGCRVVGQSSGGQFVRYLGVDVDGVNQSWLCDKGRFGFEAIHSSDRLTTPIIRRDGEASEASWNEALNEIVAAIRWANERGGPEQIGIIGGSRLSNEDAFAWSKLAKAVIKTDSIDAQIGDGLPAATVLGLPRATIDEAANASLIITLAPDLREELPVLFLRLHKSLEAGSAKLIECSSIPTSLTKFATHHLAYLPGEAARLATALVGGAANELTGIDGGLLGDAKKLIAEHQKDGNVVVVIGRTSISESAESLGTAANVLRQAFPNVKFLSALRRANVHGALDMGLAPGILPGRVSLDEGRSQLSNSWGELCDAGGLDTTAMLKAAAAGELTTLILLGADPLSDFPDRRLATEALQKVPFSVSIGTHPDASSALSHVVLPVAGDAERNGSTTNLEGRVTRLAPKVVHPGVSWPAWMVAAELAQRLGGDLGFDSIESIQDEIASVAPAYRGLNATILNRGDLRDGVVVPVRATAVAIGARGALQRFDPIATPGISSVVTQGAPMTVGATVDYESANGTSASESVSMQGAAVPAELPSANRLDSYSLRLVARRSLYDNATLTMHSSSLRELVAAPVARVHPNELARFGVTSGDQLKMRSAHGELNFEALADDTVPRNVVVIATNVASPDSVGVNALISIDDHGTDIRLETT